MHFSKPLIYNAYKGILYLALIVTVSCSQNKPNINNSKRFNMLSSLNNLFMIGSIDFKKIIQKSDFENNKQLPMEINMAYKMFVRDLIDSDLVGLQLEGNNPIAIALGEKNESPIVVLTLNVLKEDKVKNGVKEFLKGTYTTKDKKNPYHIINDNGMVLAWDEEDAVFVTQDFGNENLVVIAKKLLDARYIDAPSNETLANYLNRTDDINFYLNIGTSLQISKKLDSKNTITDEVINNYKDAILIGYTNFENGSIISKASFTAPNLPESELDFVNSNPVSPELLNYLSANNKLIGFYTANINLSKMLTQMRKLNPETQSEISEFEATIGISNGALNSLFSGEISISLVDITEPQTSKTFDDFYDDFYTSQPQPIFLATVGINNEEQITTLLNNSKLLKKTNYYAIDELFITVINSKIIATNNESLAKEVATSKQLPNYKLPTNIKITQPLFGFLNTDSNRFPNGLMAIAKEEEGQALLEFLNLFENITFEGNITNATLEITLKNKNDNALKTISDFAFKLGQKSEIN